jgi:hypothetical protein
LSQQPVLPQGVVVLLRLLDRLVLLLHSVDDRFAVDSGRDDPLAPSF